MKFSEILEQVGNPTQFYADLKYITGSHNATLFLGQLTYWTGKGHLTGGWIYKTQDDWELELELSAKEQEQARKLLKANGLIEERYKGIPRRLEYRLNRDNLDAQWEIWLPVIKLKDKIKECKKTLSVLKKDINDDSEDALEKAFKDLCRQFEDMKKERKNPEIRTRAIFDNKWNKDATKRGDSRGRKGETAEDKKDIPSIYSKTTQETTSKNTQERSQSSRVCVENAKPINQESNIPHTNKTHSISGIPIGDVWETSVIDSYPEANESRQHQDMNEVQNVEYTYLDADPNISGNPHSAPPLNSPQEKNNEVIGGELVILEGVQAKYGANMKGEKMPSNLQKIWDNFWAGKIDKIPYDECVAIAKYEIGDVLEDVVFTGYWSSRPRFKQEFVNFRIANGLTDDAHARRTIKNELDPASWDVLRGSWQSFKLKQMGMTTKQAMREFNIQQTQAQNGGKNALEVLEDQIRANCSG